MGKKSGSGSGIRIREENPDNISWGLETMMEKIRIRDQVSGINIQNQQNLAAKFAKT
jgi:hypothetical protein